MVKFASAEFIISAVNRTERTFAQIGKNVDNMDRRFSRLGSSIGRIGPILATAFVGKQIADTITTFEKLEASLRTVTGSADNAKGVFTILQEFAAATPFQLEEVVAAFIKLKALGLEPSEEALRSYGNTAVAMGKSLNQFIEAVADAATGEFERLKEFGIRAKVQGEQVTFTFQGVSTTVGKNAAEIEAYLRSIGQVQFAGAMEEQAGTLNVALSNMSDAFSRLVKSIGDAGLTDLLISIANGVKFLAEQITASIEPFKLGFEFFIAELQKFANNFIATLIGIGDAIAAFVEGVAARFSALGEDIGNFLSNPLEGFSFENTKQVLEEGLVDSMQTAFDEMIMTAQEANKQIDMEMEASADKVVASMEKKINSLEDLAKKSEEVVNKAEQKTGESQDKMKKKSEDTTSQMEKDFENLGKKVEDDLVGALDAIGGKFESFGDFAKSILSDINQILLKAALQSLGVTGPGGLIEGLFGSLGGLFGGFFAEGGKVGANKPVVVGEEGPELFVPGTSGSIIPNNRLAMAGGGGRINNSNVIIHMNVHTPDVRGFRKSGNQIAADMARQIERSRRNL